MQKVLLATLGLLLFLTVAACEDGTSTKNKTPDIKEVISSYSAGNSDNVSASVTSTELIVTESDTKEVAYKLPDEEFFVSIAPYISVTHPCANHSLTGCQGELVLEEFDIHIQDEEGNVIVNETMTSLENGFIDLWLPRGETFQVTIEHKEKTAKAEISTFEGDNTCITSMKLI
ncbi:hypothetical protein SAMN04487944_11374 [Gracilibacillus ureilyticus]|uniref:Uncharacterized protein n=1 Tax=Gracilibacillus ureilyticus TaxID=531814 RepID=A0A1H9TAN2_9BACI|nr:CueP family metal-binding protein [Gracilibacillus ureilyticus]SER94282.1 hypothetical protein SAMN04487944_11374 [Gracilibacillus ureilyticus]